MGGGVGGWWLGNAEDRDDDGVGSGDLGFGDVVTCVEEVRHQGGFAVRKVAGDLIVLQRAPAGASM